MVVLGLDPGAAMGYAVGLPGGKPVGGMIRLDSKMSIGRRLCLAEDRIRNIIATHEVDFIVAEAKFIQTDKKRFNIASTEFGYRLEGAILMAAEREGLGPKYIEWVSPGAWRKFAFGSAAAPKELTSWQARRDHHKGSAVLLCAQRGWGVLGEDSAEAALLWSYGCELVQPKSTEHLLPLFEMCHLG